MKLKFYTMFSPFNVKIKLTYILISFATANFSKIDKVFYIYD